MEGRSGVPIFDEKNGTDTINSTLFIYGSGANKYAGQFVSNISKKWNDVGGTVIVASKIYKAIFNIDAQYRYVLQSNLDGINITRTIVEK